MRIGEVAHLSGVPARTLRFYETQRLLAPPQRLANGYRDYTPDVVGRLRFIRSAQGAGLTLTHVRDVLDLHDRGLAPCARVNELLAQRLAAVQEQISALITLQFTLQTLLGRARNDAPGTDVDVCWILESRVCDGAAVAGS
ncbi:heavy metal-responsive transcriptional regulator [Mycobacteroides abscessus]|uniref:heavy metal-responsive transcriptional regulator n=1 Tax=Mycobacteriaceae TaxID=1762 RepID=UPI0008DD7A8A|nr:MULTISPECIES: heavy metal-responsive transcriptional regulator [Mycobacteriaceae]RIR16509.1 heavy metal-responsive transcriptional regulator [Mycobacteroides abscessus]